MAVGIAETAGVRTRVLNERTLRWNELYKGSFFLPRLPLPFSFVLYKWKNKCSAGKGGSRPCADNLPREKWISISILVAATLFFSNCSPSLRISRFFAARENANTTSTTFVFRMTADFRANSQVEWEIVSIIKFSKFSKFSYKRLKICRLSNDWQTRQMFSNV